MTAYCHNCKAPILIATSGGSTVAVDPKPNPVGLVAIRAWAGGFNFVRIALGFQIPPRWIRHNEHACTEGKA